MTSPIRLLLSLCLACASAVTSLPTHADDGECAKSDTTPVCVLQRLESEYDRSEREMNRVKAQVVRKMSRPQDEYLDYARLRTRFRLAQAEWLRFRTVECDAWYVLNAAGAGRNETELECLIARTNERKQQLRQWLGAIPG